MAVGYPGPINVYIPSFDASGKLIVSFSRNVKDFPLNRYLKITKVKKPTGYFLRITAEQAARILSADGSERLWSPGQDAPLGTDNTESFEFIPYVTERYAFPFQLDYLTVDNADWNILAQHAAMVAQQAMTQRTKKAVVALTTAGNYGSTSTATALIGGFVNTGTATDPLFLKLMNAAAQAIFKATLGKVKASDLQIVIGPDVADALARSQEVHAYLKESPFAMSQVKGDAPNFNQMYGLPEKLYGYPICVEDTVINAVKKGATASRVFTMANAVSIVARPGALEGAEGTSSFSTFELLMHEEMTVESKDDPDNRMHRGRVVENYTVQSVAPASGYLVTAALS